LQAAEIINVRHSDAFPAPGKLSLFLSFERKEILHFARNTKFGGIFSGLFSRRSLDFEILARTLKPGVPEWFALENGRRIRREGITLQAGIYHRVYLYVKNYL
jgi:hypothetical protein